MSAWRDRALFLLRRLVAETSQSDVARRMGTRQSSVSSWLSGARALKRENAEAMCKLANVPPAYLDDARGPLMVDEWKRKRSGVRPESTALDLVRTVIDDHHVADDDARKLLALPWDELAAVIGEIDEDAVLAQWMAIRRKAPPRPVTGAQKR